jgi:hypothetical protein
VHECLLQTYVGAKVIIICVKYCILLSKKLQYVQKKWKTGGNGCILIVKWVAFAWCFGGCGVEFVIGGGNFLENVNRFSKKVVNFADGNGT